MIYARAKRDEIISWMEEVLHTSMSEEILNTPINELNLSVRASNVLAEAGMKTISDFVLFGPDKLCRVRNAGKKTIYEISNAIKELASFKSQTYAIKEISFVDAMNNILTSITPKILPLIEARYGYEDGRCKTLEEIGNRMGVTRERIRQIIAKEIRRIKHPKRREVLQALIENIERLLLQYNGIISINDIAKDNYFAGGTRRQLRFLMNLIAGLYEEQERYRIFDKYFLTDLSDDEIKLLQSKIREAALKYYQPLIDEIAFIEKIISAVGPISKDYLSYYLLYKEHIELSKGRVLSPRRLSIPKRVKFLMREINRPMHFKEIAKLYRNHFGNAKIRTSDLDRAIHARISDSKDFIIVNAGTFMLREQFKVPSNINEIVKVSREILYDLKTIFDTRDLIRELKKRKIDIGNLNSYSLKAILLEYPDFVSHRKFEIGIKELADEYKKESLRDSILRAYLLE